MTQDWYRGPSSDASAGEASPNNNVSKSRPSIVTHDRRNDFDVTNTVQVSSSAAVRTAVQEIFSSTFPGASFDSLWLAFYDFERLFTGRVPGYLGCDTTYHDQQHTLDMTLAAARLIEGYERSVEPSDRLGPHRAQLALIVSLFHDAGYIRHEERDSDYKNGAEFTMYHVTRSADFLRRYLPSLGLARDTGVASMIVHFTGYELDIDNIELDDPRDVICGHLIGTADLIAQMADRCYLEKCRDRLYREFVLGGVAVENTKPGEYKVRYTSGEDLLKKTPFFYQQVSRDRLNLKFNRSYRYMEVVFDGRNPYIDAIRANMTHLIRIIQSGDWSQLRRKPPFFLGVMASAKDVEKLVKSQLSTYKGRLIESQHPLFMPV